jgi:hypothetical protein
VVRLGAAAVAALLAGPVALAAVLACVQLLSPVVGAAINSSTLRLVEYHVYGRVSGTLSFIGSALQPLAPAAAGLLLQHAGTGPALGAVAVLFGLCAITVFAGRRGLDLAAPTGPGPAGAPDGEPTSHQEPSERH